MHKIGNFWQTFIKYDHLNATESIENESLAHLFAKTIYFKIDNKKHKSVYF